MTAYKRGDIVLVPFPFSDQTTTKKRPAVVISSSRYNAVSQDIIIMAVTSQTEKSFDIGECLIKNLERGRPSQTLYNKTCYFDHRAETGSEETGDALP
jgi:hypothetical protein